jgi:hypothetical protein
MNYFLIAGLVILAALIVYLISKRKLIAARYQIQQLEKEKKKNQKELLQLQKDKIDLLKVMDMEKPERERNF